MANIQDSILKAVDTLVNNRIDKIQADKTITASIVKCTNALTREYKCSYNGGTILAYANEGSTYTNGQSVYVLVPQNDFTKTKTIVGKAQASSDDNNISFVSSALSNYNLIGRNIIQDKYSLEPIGLHSYLKEEYALLYQYGETSNSTNKYYVIDGDELTNNLKEAEAVMIEGSFQTRLPKEHRLSKTGVYGLQFVLAFADRDNIDENGQAATKYYSYVLDSNNMTGNPFNSTSWTEQYMIYPIDLENFLYIDSIMFYEKDFVTKDNKVQADDSLGWGSDIFLKNVEFYGLKTITATNGDYKLSLSMPQGSTLKSLTSKASLQVTAKVTEKEINNLSDNTTFYWFKEDNRVTSTSEDYQMYGGTGWARLKDKGVNYNFVTYGNENRAYENKYLCVAIYKEKVILKEYFTLYNNAAKRNLSISSSLGVKFSFDRGVPTLTCLIDGKESGFETGKVNAHPDNYFRFVWSKEDEYGNITIFNETKNELQQRYDNAVKSGKFDYSTLSALKSQINSLEDVIWDKNKLTYPVKSIDSQANFKCSIYLRDRATTGNETVEDIEYNIGSASITLQNEGAASPTDYYITIENGDQVFQYSESGVSPDDDRYADPLEVLPLECHFYDPAGLEVNNQTYEIKWQVPLTDSMIVVPTEGMTTNNASGKIEWCTSQTYPMEIKDNYDYQALNNQIKAIVTYQGQEYTQYTTFLFTKVGENGTNGTDIVAKISPLSKSNILQNDLLTLQLKNNTPYRYNTGQLITEKVLDFNLYQRNEKLSVTAANVKWQMSGGNSKTKYLGISNGTLTWSSSNQASRMFRNQIVRANIKWENYDYYAFYSIPIVNYPSGNILYDVHIDNTKTLKSITYNADGRNPLYNKNQGISITLGNGLTNRYIVWSAEGGMPTQTRSNYSEHPTNPDFKLIHDKNSGANIATTLLKPSKIYSESGADLGYESLTELYILPNDVYSGEYSNNLVYGRVYSSKTVYDNGGNPEVEIYIPIYMSLNTYGLKSLNAWDGNHVEINEDENYILAPQIGAGSKDDENKFTGVLMGTSQTYDADDPSIGLLGYSHGKQSIWLDAETGNAIFGLPEDQASQANKYNEGRIELIPGGTSSVGNWKIGSRSLYNIVQDDDNLGSEEEIGSKYSDLSNRYTVSIPHDAEGVLLSAEPAYISIKGRLLEDGSSPDADFTAANTIVQPHDAFELQLDPNDPSIFTMYRHTNSAEGIDFVVYNNKIYLESDTSHKTPYSTAITNSSGTIIGWNCQTAYRSNQYVIARRIYEPANNSYSGSWYFELVKASGEYRLPEFITSATEKAAANQKLFDNFVWHREPKVGINNQGRFYTNALKDNTTALTIGDLGAFNQRADRHRYVGATFDVGTGSTSNSLVKFFTPTANINDAGGTLYITGATRVDNEYQRPLSMHFKNYSIYASSGNNYNQTTNDRLILSDTKAEFGHKNSYLSIPFAGNAELKLSNNLLISTDSDNSTNRNITFTTGAMATIINNGTAGSYKLSATGIGELSFTRGLILSTTLDYKLTSQTFKHTMTEKNMFLGAADNSAYLSLNSSSGSTSTLLGEAINITSSKSGIKLISNNTADGITLQANPSQGTSTSGVSIKLQPQTGGSASIFSISSPNGTIQSTPSLGNADSIKNLSGISVSGILNPNSLFVPGVINKAGTDVQKNSSIITDRDIRTLTGWVYSNEFAFHSNKTWNSYNGANTSAKVTDHLGQIYNLLNDLRTLIKTAQNAADNAQKRADSAYDRANSVLNTINGRGYATTSWVSSNYTSIGRFNGHYHGINTTNHANYGTTMNGDPSHAHNYYYPLWTNSPE